METKNKVFLLDAMALIYRAHFAFSKNPIVNSKGLNTSAIYGFLNTLLELIRKEKPTHLAIAFDTKAPTFRTEIFNDYKANRERQPEDIQIAIPIIKKLIKHMNIKIPFLGDGIESANVVSILVSPGDTIDKDQTLIELETDKVTQEIYAPSKGSITEILFQEDQDVKVGQIIAKIESLEETKQSNQDINSLNQTKETIQDINSSSAEFNIVIPALGESITEVVISKWLKKEEMIVKKGEPIVEIETDKVTQDQQKNIDLDSFADGIKDISKNMTSNMRNILKSTYILSFYLLLLLILALIFRGFT